MLKNRALAALLAVLLAIAGGVLVFTYAANAERRALEGLQTVEVLVVQQAIPAGTPASELGASVAVLELPAKAVADGAVADASELGDTTAAVDLVPGEQVLASRFVAEEDVEGGIPAGTQQLTVGLKSGQIYGGGVAAGDSIGLFVSFAEGTTGAPSSTQSMYDDIYVMSVQAPDEGGDATDTAVTLAVTAEQARKIIYAIEFGSVWFTKQPGEFDDTVSGELTREGFAE